MLRYRPQVNRYRDVFCIGAHPWNTDEGLVTVVCRYKYGCVTVCWKICSYYTVGIQYFILWSLIPKIAILLTWKIIGNKKIHFKGNCWDDLHINLNYKCQKYIFAMFVTFSSTEGHMCRVLFPNSEGYFDCLHSSTTVADTNKVSRCNLLQTSPHSCLKRFVIFWVNICKKVTKVIPFFWKDI